MKKIPGNSAQGNLSGENEHRGKWKRKNCIQAIE
jgi:hypothetical protein